VQVTIGKLAASLLALGYIVAAALSTDGLSFAGLVALAVLLPLALIWFPDEIENWARLGRSGGLRGLRMLPSPSWLVAIMGWVLLVGLPLFLLLRKSH
jgi:hypothetical protein